MFSTDRHIFFRLSTVARPSHSTRRQARLACDGADFGGGLFERASRDSIESGALAFCAVAAPSGLASRTLVPVCHNLPMCGRCQLSEKEHTAIPNGAVILLSGIPGTGKSRFGRHLAREHGFAHYDLECYPHGWPHQELKSMWDANRSAFVAQVRQHHDRIALDWGFPVSCLSWVEELQKCGVRLVWFDGDVAHARQVFEQRGRAAEFDVQVAGIQKAGYPASLNCVVVPALSDAGLFLDNRQIESIIFQ